MNSGQGPNWVHKRDDHYWAVDLPGLTEEGARAVVEFAGGLPGVLGPTPIDPKYWLTLNCDRGTVEGLAAALRRIAAPVRLEAAMLDDFEEWLGYADSATSDSNDM